MNFFLRIVLFALAAAFVCNGPAALASGIAVPIQGGRALGAGFAVSSDPYDLTCIYHNPAGLARLGKGQIYAGANNGYANVHFTKPGEDEVHLEQNVFYLPFLGASSNFGIDKFASGFAFYAPFGARMDYPQEGPQRDIIQYVDLQTMYLTGAVAYNFTDRISAGLGVSYIYAKLELEQTRNMMGFEVDVGAEADDSTVGWNCGLLADVTDQITVGLAYTSQADGNLQGDVGALRPALVRQMFPDRYDITDLKVSLPAFYRAGLTWRITPQWKSMVDLFYWEWSVWKENRIKIETNPFGITELVFPRNWEDSITLVMGTEYAAPDSPFTYRAGLAYDQNAIPDETVDLGPADSEKYAVTVGLGYRFTPGMEANLGLAYIMYDDRNIKNSIVEPSTNGKYTYDMGFLNVDFIYRF